MARLLPLVILLGFASLAEANVVISEVLADPPSGAAGDANQDGQRDTYGDEFVELYNAGSAPVDISGWRLGDSSSSETHFQFPPNAVIEPGSYVVLFGGGTPSGFAVPVYTDDGRIGNGLTNKGEDIRLIDDTGAEIAVVSHGDWPNDQSLVRHPLDSDTWVAHKTASPTGAAFSPGRATDAEPETPIEPPIDPPDPPVDPPVDPPIEPPIEPPDPPVDPPIEPPDPPVDPPIEPPDPPVDPPIEPPDPPVDPPIEPPIEPPNPSPAYDLVISEVLADPPSGAAGDANQDGQRDTYEDEFVELYNAGSAPVDISGWRLGDSASSETHFQFPPNAVIDPGSYVVLFGGGDPTGFTVPVYIDDGRIGNGLTNKGEDIRLIDDNGTEVAIVSHGDWPNDQSLVRHPLDSDTWVAHKTASPTGVAFSPGRATDAEPAPPIEPPVEPPIDPPDPPIEPPVDPPIEPPVDPPIDPPDPPIEPPIEPPVDPPIDPPDPPIEPPVDPPNPSPDYLLVISEVLADPPSGAAGDANQDGQRDTYEDEFVELYNAGSAPVDLSGWRLGDSASSDTHFQFPPNAVIDPGSYVVLFGGGTPSGFAVPVYIDDGRIGNGLTNKGEDIRLIDDTGTEVAVVSHGDWPNDQSLVRHPLDSDTWVAHKTASPTSTPFSPGRATDAEPETPIDPPIDPPDPPVDPPDPPVDPPNPSPSYALVISEVLADPPSGAAGDANQDGQRDTYEDEFVELYNAGSSPIDLSGWRLGDSASSDTHFQFPPNAVIDPSSYVVLFGGGTPSGFAVPVYTDDGRIGNGLTNGGEDIRLTDDTGTEIAVVSHGTWPSKQSLVRHPLDSDTWVAHKTASATSTPFSPGRAIDVETETPETPKPETPETSSGPPPTYDLFISEVLADPPSRAAGDANRDGQRDGYEDEFVELYNAGSTPISLSGWRLGDSRSPNTHFRFPADAVIAPRSYVVLFGGGTPSGFTVPVYTDDGRIGNGLTNKGEDIRLTDDNGHEIAVVSHDDWPKDQSLVRILSARSAFVPHKMVSPSEAPFSPGHAPKTRPVITYSLFISEVLADPPEGPAGDANRDGQCDPYEDEFIELYNAGPVPISLAGWRLGDADSISDYFRFPRNAVIAPRSYVILFGGGRPSGFTIPVYTDDGRIGNGLTNSGESIHLINDHGNEAASLFQATWPDTQSLVRTPSDGRALVPHKTVSPSEAPFSPGHAPKTRPILIYDLFISEVLADPPEGLAGDANRDGRRDPHQDEFIELYNAGPVPISLAGWRLGDAGSLSDYFRFPRDAIIEPDSYVVLFGGGRPSGFAIPVYTDDGTIGDGLTNSGESIHLIDDHGDEIAFLSQATWPDDQSIVSTPPDEEAFVPHKTVSPSEAPFSPGIAPETQTKPKKKKTPPVPKPDYALFISEVLADPAGDANRDGQYDPYEDEFIELYNAGSTPIDLSGWRLGDAASLFSYFYFPRNAVIAPRSYVVLFGGGTPSGFTVPVYTEDGRIGNGLTNSGEAIYLIDSSGDLVASVSHATWPQDQSIVRSPPNGGAFVPHKTASLSEAPFSPGRATDTPKPPGPTLVISEVLADPPAGAAGDANQDGQRNGYEDEFVELYNAGQDTLSLAGWRLGDSTSSDTYFRFPPDAVIDPGSYVVLFGGGTPSGFTVPVYTEDGRIGNGLTNSGEEIRLIDDTGTEVASVSHDTWPQDQSIARTPPNGGAFVPHKTASLSEAPFSPGRATDTPPEPASKIPAMASATSLQVWPNPFNATAHLSFHLSHAASVSLAIYNVQGQRVRTLVEAPLHPGVHRTLWDGRDERGHAAATGPYFARFRIAHGPPRYAKLVLVR